MGGLKERRAYWAGGLLERGVYWEGSIYGKKNVEAKVNSSEKTKTKTKTKKRKKASRSSVVSFAAVFSVVSQISSLPTKGALRHDPKNGC